VIVTIEHASGALLGRVAVRAASLRKGTFANAKRIGRVEVLDVRTRERAVARELATAGRGGEELVEGSVGTATSFHAAHDVLEPPPEIAGRDASCDREAPSGHPKHSTASSPASRTIAIVSGALPCMNSAPSSMGAGARASRWVKMRPPMRSRASSHLHAHAALAQRAGRGQTGYTRADDDDVSLARGAHRDCGCAARGASVIAG